MAYRNSGLHLTTFIYEPLKFLIFGLKRVTHTYTSLPGRSAFQDPGILV